MSKVTHVLVVEDDEAVRRGLVRRLRKEIEKRGGLPVDLIEADCAEKAFDRILSNPGDPWFILTDNNLFQTVGAVQTGLEFLRLVRENIPRIRSFRILTSGDAMDTPHLRERFGVDVFLQKPCDIIDVADLLVAFLASD